MPAEVKLTNSELDEAFAFIQAEGYAYYFPEPFEADAIRSSWNKVRPVLSRINLLSYDPKPTLALIAPKQKFAVRPIDLPDPVDLILFTGLGLRLAPRIEAARVPRERRRVLSFRYGKTSSGHATFTSDWGAWVTEIQRRTESQPFVARADIVDFFPRLYLHRLENALSAATGLEPVVRALFRFLNVWSGGTSYGIPIGPKVCNILAEAVLSEVDEYLASCGLDFIRHIDDFALFGTSPTHCLRALYILGERLEKTQGLSLNMAKTKVLRTSDLAQQLLDPKDVNAALRKKVVDDIFGGDPYEEIDYENLDEDQRTLLDSVNAKALLEKALSGDMVDLPMAKFVLNMLSALRRPELDDLVLDNLGLLSPVSDAVARFLMVFEESGAAERVAIAGKVLHYIRSTDFVPDYQVAWLLQPFSSSPNWHGLEDLRVIAREHKNRYVRRQAILALGQLAQRSALLDLKSCIDDAKDWEWRAIVFASRGLPKDERKAFLSKLTVSSEWNPETLTDKATVEYVKSLT